jgi:hypothetical protein
MYKRYHFEELELNKSKAFPIGNKWKDRNSIRAAACDYGKRTGKKFSCKHDTLTESTTVTRIK